MVGLVGLTGSGKSTLLKLLMRYYDVNEGVIWINNHNIRILIFKFCVIGLDCDPKL